MCILQSGKLVCMSFVYVSIRSVYFVCTCVYMHCVCPWRLYRRIRVMRKKCKKGLASQVRRVRPFYWQQNMQCRTFTRKNVWIFGATNEHRRVQHICFSLSSKAPSKEELNIGTFKTVTKNDKERFNSNLQAINTFCPWMARSATVSSQAFSGASNRLY